MVSELFVPSTSEDEDEDGDEKDADGNDVKNGKKESKNVLLLALLFLLLSSAINIFSE